MGSLQVSCFLTESLSTIQETQTRRSENKGHWGLRVSHKLFIVYKKRSLGLPLFHRAQVPPRRGPRGAVHEVGGEVGSLAALRRTARNAQRTAHTAHRTPHTAHRTPHTVQRSVFSAQVHIAGSERIVANRNTPKNIISYSRRRFATRNAETGL